MKIEMPIWKMRSAGIRSATWPPSNEAAAIEML